jgi:cation transport ATPase
MRVAADGVILTGHSSLDEAMVTGESMPVSRGPGDAVITGTTNSDGVLEVEVRAVGADTRLARMTRLVEEAQIRPGAGAETRRPDLGRVRAGHSCHRPDDPCRLAAGGRRF